MDTDTTRSPTATNQDKTPKTPNSILKRARQNELKDEKRRRRVSFAYGDDMEQVHEFVTQPVDSSSGQSLGGQENTDVGTTQQQRSPKTRRVGGDNELPQLATAEVKGNIVEGASQGHAPERSQPLQQRIPLSPVEENNTVTTSAVYTINPRDRVQYLAQHDRAPYDDDLNFDNLVKNQEWLPDDAAAARDHTELSNMGSSAAPEPSFSGFTMHSAGYNDPYVKSFRNIGFDGDDPMSAQAWREGLSTAELNEINQDTVHTAGSNAFGSYVAAPQGNQRDFADETSNSLLLTRNHEPSRRLSHSHAAYDPDLQELPYTLTNQVDTVQLLLEDGNTARLREDGNTGVFPVQYHKPAEARALSPELAAQEARQQQQQHLHHEQQDLHQPLHQPHHYNQQDHHQQLHQLHHQQQDQRQHQHPQNELHHHPQLDQQDQQQEEQHPPFHHPHHHPQLDQPQQPLHRQQHSQRHQLQHHQLHHHQQELQDRSHQLHQDHHQPGASIREKAADESKPLPIQELYEYLKDAADVHLKNSIATRGKSLAPHGPPVQDYYGALVQASVEMPLDEEYGRLAEERERFNADLQEEVKRLEQRLEGSEAYARLWKMSKADRDALLRRLCSEAMETGVQWEKEVLQAKENQRLCSVLQQHTAELEQLLAEREMPRLRVEVEEVVAEVEDAERALQQELEDLEAEQKRVQAERAAELARLQARLKELGEELGGNSDDDSIDAEHTEPLEELDEEGSEDEVTEEDLAESRQKLALLQRFLGLKMRPSSSGRGDGYYYGRMELVELQVHEEPEGTLHCSAVTHPENLARHARNIAQHNHAVVAALLDIYAADLLSRAVTVPSPLPVTFPLRLRVRAMAAVLREVSEGVILCPGLYDIVVKPQGQLHLGYVFPDFAAPADRHGGRELCFQLEFPAEALLDIRVLNARHPMVTGLMEFDAVGETEVLAGFWKAVDRAPLTLARLSECMRDVMVEAGVCKLPNRATA